MTKPSSYSRNEGDRDYDVHVLTYVSRGDKTVQLVQSKSSIWCFTSFFVIPLIFASSAFHFHVVLDPLQCSQHDSPTMKVRTACMILVAVALLSLLIARQFGAGGLMQVELLEATLRVAGLEAKKAPAERWTKRMRGAPSFRCAPHNATAAAAAQRVLDVVHWGCRRE